MQPQPTTSDINNSTTLVQMLPKGLVTIPQNFRRQLGLDPKQRPYLRVKVEQGSIKLEPVQVISESQLRDYSASEIDRFLEQDKLASDTQNWVKEVVDKYEPKK